MTTLHGNRVVLRPLQPADTVPLRATLATPEVTAWWGAVPDGFPATDDPDATRLAIVADGELAGLVQFGEEPDPDYRHAWIDVFVDPRMHGRGIGTDAVRTLARHLLEERGHHRVTIDPAADNAVAIRSYAKAGFEPVGVLRRAWRDPDGRWRDVLLMEMVSPADRVAAGARPVPAPGSRFPDVELLDHAGNRRRLSELAAGDPVVLQFYRGWWCPKEQAFFRRLVALQDEAEVAYCRMLSVSVDPPAVAAAFRAGLGARWTFLADPDRSVQERLGLRETTDTVHDPYVPAVFTLFPDLTVHRAYDGYWFWGRPTLEELRRDLREISRRIRPDWNAPTP